MRWSFEVSFELYKEFRLKSRNDDNFRSGLVYVKATAPEPFKPYNTVADQGGGKGRVPPLVQFFFFIFMKFLGNVGQIVGWRHLPKGLASIPLWDILDPTRSY